MRWEQLGFGVFLLCISMFLRSWGKVNERLPSYLRPLAFQNRRFTVFLSMVGQGTLVIGVLMISLVEFWMGVAAVVVCYFGLSPLMVFFLGKLLGHDKIQMPPGKRSS